MTAPSTKRVTIADVARAAGLSTATVSHALNGVGQVSEQARRQVLEVAARLRYEPNIRARRLRTGRSHAIALLSSMPPAISAGKSQLGFFTELAVGIAQTALQRGYVLLLAPPSASGDNVHLLDIDGAILLEPTPGDPLARKLDDRGIPYITIGGEIGPRDIDLNPLQAADLMLAHLQDTGARAMGAVLGASGRTAQRVFRTRYLEFARRHGMAPALAEVPESGGEQAAYTATRTLLADHPALDALCVPIDAFASGAAQAARDAGRRIGTDLRLITRYDGLRAQTCTPPLSAINLHLPAISQAAVTALLALLGDGAPGTRPHALPTPTLVVRASTVSTT